MTTSVGNLLDLVLLYLAARKVPPMNNAPTVFDLPSHGSLIVGALSYGTVVPHSITVTLIT